MWSNYAVNGPTNVGTTRMGTASRRSAMKIPPARWRCGHADEIGLMVNHITDDGFCTAFKSVGLTPPRWLAIAGFNPPLTVWTSRSWFVADRGALQDKAGDAKVRKLHGRFVDIAARSREERCPA